MSVRSWARDLVDLLLPMGCVACGTWIGDEATPICVACRVRLKEAPWPRCPRCHHPLGTGRAPADDCLECRDWSDHLDGARWAYELADPAEHLVHALKYEGWRELADFMARAMAEAARPVPRDAVVVPVPTTRRRLRQRGYNQAELLADRVTRITSLRVVRALLRHDSGASSQTALTPAERRANVRGAFAPDPARSGAVRGRPVLLVDDVLTTGATSLAAAEALKGAGARRVTLVAFARALPFRHRQAA